MATYQRGKYWWHGFRFAGERIDEPAKSTSRTVVKEAINLSCLRTSTAASRAKNHLAVMLDALITNALLTVGIP
jgi:hypothetical protein